MANSLSTFVAGAYNVTAGQIQGLPGQCTPLITDVAQYTPTKLSQFISFLLSLQPSGAIFLAQVQSWLATSPYPEKVSELLLHALEHLVKAKDVAVPLLKNALERAIAVAQEFARQAVGFAKDHPVYCTLLVLGMMANLWGPLILDKLGFAVIGIREGESSST